MRKCVCSYSSIYIFLTFYLNSCVVVRNHVLVAVLFLVLLRRLVSDTRVDVLLDDLGDPGVLRLQSAGVRHGGRQRVLQRVVLAERDATSM